MLTNVSSKELKMNLKRKRKLTMTKLEIFFGFIKKQYFDKAEKN